MQTKPARLRARHGDDNFWTGVLFVALGAFAAIYGSRYGLGSMQRFGAGAFPAIVGVMLCSIGAALIVKALRGTLTPAGVRPFQWRSLACITGAVIFGGAALQYLGLVIAVPGAVAIASLAAERPRWTPIAIMAVLLSAFAYLVFFLGLGIQLPLYPGAM